MTELDYIRVSNITNIRAADRLLRDVQACRGSRINESRLRMILSNLSVLQREANQAFDIEEK